MYIRICNELDIKLYLLSHDWQNSRLLIGQLAYDMKLY